MESLQIFNTLLLVTVIVYGATYGVRNYATDIMGILFNRSVVQSSLGKFFDCVWLLSTLYLTLFYFNIFDIKFDIMFGGM